LSNSTKPWPQNLNKQQRIDSAQSKVDELVNRVLQASTTRASNKFMQFPSGRPGISRAAVCFNNLMEDQFKYETLLLASFWDKASSDRNSIPTIVKLVDDRRILKALRQNAEDQYQPSYAEYRNEEVQKFDSRWLEATNICNRLPCDLQFNELLKYRHREIAHSVRSENVIVDNNVIRLAGPFWDDTIKCISNLYSAITLRGFDFRDLKRVHEKNARDFWLNLRLGNSPED
jgi:AbiU2